MEGTIRFRVLRHLADQIRSRDDVALEKHRSSTARMAILQRKRGTRVSTIVPPPPTIPPADPGWIPSPLFRMTVEQYEAMVESGAFKARDRFSGIPVCWIVNLVNRQFEDYSDLGLEGYRSRVDFPVGQAVPVVIGGQQFGQVAVDDILPSRPAKPKTEGNRA
jgi:hypothetical protein